MIPENSNAIWNFDKLRGMKPEGPEFCIECPQCHSKDVDLFPYNISWKSKTNTDKLPPKIKKSIDNLPNRINAILLGMQQHNVYFVCNTCGHREFITEYVNPLILTKWLNKKYG